MRVFFQRYMDCLEKKCVLMIGDFVGVVGEPLDDVGEVWCGRC